MSDSPSIAGAACLEAEVRVALARPQTTLAVLRGARRCLALAGFATVAEMTFASGRRADIVALSPQGEIWVVEIKSCLADFRADSKWPDYAAFCDGLAFAVTPDFPAALIPEPIGLLVADAYGGELVRHPELRPLPAPRRKAVTLAFARLAAQRLQGLVDPFEPG